MVTDEPESIKYLEIVSPTWASRYKLGCTAFNLTTGPFLSTLSDSGAALLGSSPALTSFPDFDLPPHPVGSLLDSYRTNVPFLRRHSMSSRREEPEYQVAC